MSTLVFDDADVIPNSNGGRRQEPNPYTEIISQIAGQKNEDTGKPVAKRFTLAHSSLDEKQTEINRARRLLSQAGKNNDPAVTVQVRDAPAPLMRFGKPTSEADPMKTVITFWTIPLVQKKRRGTTTADLSNNSEG